MVFEQIKKSYKQKFFIRFIYYRTNWAYTLQNELIHFSFILKNL